MLMLHATTLRWLCLCLCLCLSVAVSVSVSVSVFVSVSVCAEGEASRVLDGALICVASNVYTYYIYETVRLESAT